VGLLYGRRSRFQRGAPKQRDSENVLRLPDEKWVGHEAGVSTIVSGIIRREDTSALPIYPTHWKDGETVGDRPDLRDFTWAQKQAAREARRRAKLGLDEAEA
jgi:hypothetical protein